LLGIHGRAEMAAKRKRFQTGPEIMREYVPDYFRRSVVIGDDRLSSKGGSDAGIAMLEVFRKKIRQAKLRVGSARRSK